MMHIWDLCIIDLDLLTHWGALVDVAGAALTLWSGSPVWATHTSEDLVHKTPYKERVPCLQSH